MMLFCIPTPVNSHSDVHCFQKDFDVLENWAQQWKMVFNVEKCQVGNFAGKHNAVAFNYKLNGKILSTSFKYLGVQIMYDFSWDLHVNSITLIASQRLGMIKRVMFDAPKQIKTIAYVVSLCRPLLEYACEVWDPFFLAEHINQIKMVQRRAVRFISNLRGREGVTSEREALGLELLQDRRKDARVKLLLKILSSDTHSPLADNFNNIAAHQTALHSNVARSVTSKQVYFNSLPKTSRDLRSSDSCLPCSFGIS